MKQKRKELTMKSNKILAMLGIIFALTQPSMAMEGDLMDTSSSSSPFLNRISDGFYTGSGHASSGEVVYYGFEQITEENKPYFDAYIGVTQNLSPGNSRGILGKVLFIDSRPSDKDKETVEKLYGGTLDEYNSFLDELNLNKTPEERRKKKEQIDTNAIQFMPYSVGNYFSYASKRPIIEPFWVIIGKSIVEHPRRIQSYGSYPMIPAKDYLDLTKDLLMTVGSGVQLDTKQLQSWD